METAPLSSLFRTLGDPLRLRLLHILSVEELTVSEIVRVLELPQSTVSRHLKALRERGLLADRPVGSATFYRASLAAELGNGDTLLRDTLATMLRETPLPPADRARLEQVLALREAEGGEFFDRMAHRWDALREACFGPTFHFEAFLHLLPAPWRVADLGTGTGYLLPALGRRFRKVIGVDRSASMLELAGRRVAATGLTNIELRVGELEGRLPLRAGEIDLAVAMILLHHLHDVAAALRSIHRALKPGGRLLLVEILPHENEAFRARMADRRPGIDPDQMRRWLTEAGMREIERWDYPFDAHPEHELAPLPGLYGMTAVKG
ncbi:MAG TPA: metalloregulator ArsR/SmtB family transcription factor [Candidatus Sumerlaeota bacterium]|nr:metalloregulator ArsR/SmtB family transcription factor [Candidatus Sumerlaeota bacterium]